MAVHDCCRCPRYESIHWFAYIHMYRLHASTIIAGCFFSRLGASVLPYFSEFARQTHQQQEADTVEFLRREYPNARMCPRPICLKFIRLLFFLKILNSESFNPKVSKSSNKKCFLAFHFFVASLFECDSGWNCKKHLDMCLAILCGAGVDVAPWPTRGALICKVIMVRLKAEVDSTMPANSADFSHPTGTNGCLGMVFCADSSDRDMTKNMENDVICWNMRQNQSCNVCEEAELCLTERLFSDYL